jgi:cyclohexadienyl dehydratase
MNVTQKKSISKTLKVGFTYDYAPFSYMNKNKHVGIDYEIAKYIAEKINAELEPIKTSWKFLHADFKKDKFTLGITGIAKTDLREEFSNFSIPYYRGGKTPICRTNDVNNLDSLEKINKKEVTIVVNKGGTNEIFVKNNFPNAKIHFEEDNKNVFDRILDNTADIMITDSIEANYMENKSCGLKRPMPNILLDNFEICIMMPKDDVLKEEIDAIILEITDTGLLELIINNHMF